MTGASFHDFLRDFDRDLKRAHNVSETLPTRGVRSTRTVHSLPVLRPAPGLWKPLTGWPVPLLMLSSPRSRQDLQASGPPLRGSKNQNDPGDIMFYSLKMESSGHVVAMSAQ